MQFYGGTNSGFASALAGFGQAIGSAMQRFKDKEQKKKDKLQTENSLISMGLDPEVAKGISGDPSLLSAYRLAQQKEYQDQMVALEKQKMVQDALPSFKELNEQRQLQQEDEISHDLITSTDFKSRFPSAYMYDPKRKDEPGYATNYLKFVKDNADTEEETALGKFMDANGSLEGLRNLEPTQVALFSRHGGRLSSLTELANLGQRQKEFQADQDEEEEPFTPSAMSIPLTQGGMIDAVERSKGQYQLIVPPGNKDPEVPFEIRGQQMIADLIVKASRGQATPSEITQLRLIKSGEKKVDPLNPKKFITTELYDMIDDLGID